MNELASREIEDRLALVERVVASVHFSRSARLSAFLRFVCDRALNGAIDQLSEQRIGVEVFGRDPAYNPSEDNIVRSHARLLRQRLEAYFDAEGRDEPTRIIIPKGAYVPAFEARSPARALQGSTAPPTRTSRRWALATAGSMALAAGGYGVSRIATAESPSRRLWKSIFDGTRNTLIVPADTGLVLAQDLTKQKIALRDYISGEYVAKFVPKEGMTNETIRRIARRRYSGIVDVALASRLAQRPEASSRQTIVRYARDLRFAELRGSNAILLGAPHSNPWLELFEKKLNFWLDLDLEKAEFVIQNRSPRTGEEHQYQTKLSDTTRPVWAVISFLPNLDGAGHVLIVAGASTAGTESAAEFLLSDRTMDAFLAQSPTPGRKPPYFNVLLESSSVNGNSPQGRPIAWRFI